MRELLFRGKSIIGKKWRYGYYYQTKYYRNNTGLEHYITIPHPDTPNAPNDNFTIYPETLGQYTGLTDKNGKKIFEGDIVLCKIIGLRETVAHKGVVEYLRDSFTVNIEGIVPPQDIIWFSIQNGDIEVIGNIHDNPELLKEREQG